MQQWSPQSPAYRVVRETGPAHAREFEVEVLVEGEVCGLGTGRSKRDAECAAALEAITGSSLAEIRRRRTTRA